MVFHDISWYFDVFRQFQIEIEDVVVQPDASGKLMDVDLRQLFKTNRSNS